MFRKSSRWLTPELITIMAVVMLSGVCPARADIVELDLFSIGCPSEYDINSPYWQKDFDLGMEFVEIDSVYIDWSGEITAGLAILYDNPDEPYPLDVGVYAGLSYPPLRRTTVWGGSNLSGPRAIRLPI